MLKSMAKIHLFKMEKIINIPCLAKKTGNKFDIMVYIGGHQILIQNGNAKVNGKDTPLQNGKDHKHTVSGQEIFTLHKWGSTVNVYSFLRVWVA